MNEPQELAFHLRPHKAALKLGEPLFLEATIRNNSEEILALKRIYGAGYLEASLTPLHILISEDRENFHRWQHNIALDFIHTTPLRLKPGAAWSGKVVVLYAVNNIIEWEHGAYAFPEAGQYFVKLECTTADGQRIQSDALEIQVTELDSDAGARAHHALQEHIFEYATLVQVGQVPSRKGKISKEGRRWFAEFIREHRDSVYVPYVAMSLGRHYLDLKEDAEEEGNLDKAEAMHREADRYLRLARNTTDNALLQELTDEALAGPGIR